MPTKIEWVKNPDGTKGETWNPVTGCTKISEGCAHCYAERMSKRLAGRCGYPGTPHNFDATLHPDRLDEPLKWRKPRRVFVCSMGDLFHEDVPTDFIWRVIQTCYEAKQHTFQVLTKRPKRALDVLTRSAWWNNDTPQNIWLGVTAENQEQADKRISTILQIPAAVWFVSVEPMLGPVDLSEWINPQGATARDDPARYSLLDWVICGGESGPDARPMHPAWARSLRDQCQMAGVPFFFKQWGEWKAISGKNPQEVIEFSRYRACQVSGSPLVLWHVGKKAAGRLLDGREWDEMPALGLDR
jgi:protein gp37